MTISAPEAEIIPSPQGQPQSAQNSWCLTRISSMVAKPHSFPLSPVAIVRIPLSLEASRSSFHLTISSSGSPLFLGPPRAPWRIPFLLHETASTVTTALGSNSSRSFSDSSFALATDNEGHLLIRTV